MLPLRSSRWFITASSILLVAGASLPDVVCCCNVSWGPGGLLGKSGQCEEGCCAASSQQRSGCEQEEQESQPSNVPECSAKHCHCTFSLVAPRPMAGSQTVHLEQSPAVLPIAGACRLGAISVTANQTFIELAGFSLTPRERCALLQTWQA